MTGEDALLGFAAALRAAGVPVDAGRVAAAAEALAHWGVAEGGPEPYWPLRIAFCSAEGHLAAFDMVYRRRFGLEPPDGESLDQVAEARTSVVAVTGPAGAAGDGPGDGDGGSGGAGDAARLAARDFEEMTDEERREAAEWVRRLRPVPRRRTMRPRPAARGRIDPARTMRLMLRNGGELLRIRRRAGAARPRRLLLLVDVSASMRPYSDMLLRLAHAALHAGPGTTEVFAIGTRYTRLTGPLRARRPEVALAAAGRVKTDWSGGTTLGIALRDFLRGWAGTSAVRSAIVVLGTDGFEFREPERLVAQVARLAGLARTLIWVDPARRGRDYRALDEHVARAQVHAAVLAGCHDFEAIRELAEAITDA
ncbi:VWA domain-containing protein [Dactylosporangium sp. CA-139066]|uniref:VWA domain-containing protein n=1 Tax=Dactylosporangium sp. CA-139066 TaxID=3239930 RepID=UPI003D8A2013